MRATAVVAAMALSRGALATTGSNCIRIFELDNFAGDNVELCESYPNLSFYPTRFDNKISSIEFGSNVNSVTFFDGFDYEGDSVRATASVASIDSLNFDDKTSSVHFDFKSLSGDSLVSAQCVLVYAGDSYSGVAAQFCQDVPDLSRFGFDNKISGIKLGADVVRFTAYDFADFAGERRTRGEALGRFGPGPFAFDDRTTSLSFELAFGQLTHVAAIDGCNAEADQCVDIRDTAAVRCCGIGGGNYCTSFCVNPATNAAEAGFLNTYEKALEICTNAGYRLCYREEVEAGDCCATGCGFDGVPAWIDERCHAPTEGTLTCGSTVSGSTVGKDDLVGNEGGDAIYLLQVVSEASEVNVTVATCGSETNYDNLVRVYPVGDPTEDPFVPGKAIARDDDGCPSSSAASVTVAVSPGSYYVVVDASNDAEIGFQEGNFELAITCV